MQNIILIVHLILALCLIAVVLLQRSEGGALGIGGGGGGGGLVSQRGAGSALGKLTWVLGTGFLCTSILLTIATDGGTGGSLLDQLDSGAIQLPGAEAPANVPEVPFTLPDPTLPAPAE